MHTCTHVEDLWTCGTRAGRIYRHGPCTQNIRIHPSRQMFISAGLNCGGMHAVSRLSAAGGEQSPPHPHEDGAVGGAALPSVGPMVGARWTCHAVGLRAFTGIMRHLASDTLVSSLAVDQRNVAGSRTWILTLAWTDLRP